MDIAWEKVHTLLLCFEFLPSCCNISFKRLCTIMKRCQGTTRAGKQCSITAASQLTNDYGRLVAAPLLKGGSFCLFHAKPFCTHPHPLERGGDVMVVLLDLETTGVSTSLDRIVEFAATHCPRDSRFFGGSFSTIVHVASDVLESRGDAAAAVHGITNEEISRGLPFPRVWVVTQDRKTRQDHDCPKHPWQ